MSTTTKEAPVAKKKKTITSQHSKFDKVADKSAQKSGTITMASPTKKGKKKKNAKDAAIKQNITNAAKNASKNNAERESKYLYSSDCKTAKDKKEFRRKARQTAKAFEKELKDLKKKTDVASVKEYQSQKKEFSTWKKKTYVKIEEKEAA